MTKQIIIVACVVVALFICFWSCSGHGYKKAIESVLEQDRQIPELAPKVNESSNIDDYLRYIGYIVKEMSAIDLYGCPDDFAQAYHNHCKAWSDLYNCTNELKIFINDNSGWNGFIKGFSNGFFFRGKKMIDEFNEEQKRIMQAGKDSDTAIYDTYDKVLVIATKYGVKTAKYRSSAKLKK